MSTPAVKSASPDPGKIKALALDLDGTLLGPDSLLSERAKTALHNCHKRGIKIIIATGRAIDAVEPFRVSLAAKGPMIYFNGAVVAEMPSGKIIDITLLDKNAAVRCLDLADEMGVYCQVFLPGAGEKPHITLVTEKDAPERNLYYEHTGILAELGDLRDILHRPELPGCVKAMFLAEPEILESLRPPLKERFGKSVYVVQTYRTFLEVLDARVSKGQGLRTAMEYYSLRKEEVIAFGDEENDLPMFDAAGFSVAPSNAKDAVKAKAKLVTASNAEDGVAAFLEEFFAFDTGA
ncbi:MAG: Cof-type HAD-IIB family hydrolase [Treponema sp.]|nr:Cof-type HAD-IIB family hydrolase [Treponema sp.]